MVNKKLGFIVAGAVVLIGGIWAGGSWYASNTAQKELRQFVQQAGLQDTIFWNDVSASLGGDLTVQGVSIGTGEDAVQIQTLEIKDVKNASDEQGIALSIKGLADFQGHAPQFLVDTMVHDSGRFYADPVDVQIKVHLDYKKDTARIELGGSLKDFGQVHGNLDLQGSSVLRPVISQLANGGLKGDGMSGFGLFMTLDSALKGVRLAQAEVSIEDDGLFARQAMIQQRYGVVPIPGQDLKEMHKQAKLITLENQLQTCQKKWMMNEDSCHKMVAFLMGDRSSVDLKVTAKRPYMLRKIVNSLRLNPEYVSIEVD